MIFDPRFLVSDKQIIKFFSHVSHYFLKVEMIFIKQRQDPKNFDKMIFILVGKIKMNISKK